jgi:hypothetical protein
MSIYYQDSTVEIRIYSSEEIQQINYNRKQESKLKYANSRKIYEKNKRQTDPLYKLRQNIRCLIRTSMKNNGFSKRSKTYCILECSFEEFKTHIQQQFKDGMSWENYGKWEYDHITPVSWAITEDEIVKLNHYSNLQPLWREENNAKSNKTAG